MPSMSYCMFENTSSEMNRLLNKMAVTGDIDGLDLNEYEQNAFRMLYKQCQEYIMRYESLAVDFIESNQIKE